MQITDIGHGQWLDAPAAAALGRARRQLGWEFIPSSAGRYGWEQQDLINKFLAGDPNIFRPAAVGTSPHEAGNAIDYGAWWRVESVLNEHGFYRPLPKTDPVHFVYYPKRDTHANDPEPTTEKENEMKYVQVKDDRGNFAMVGPDGVGRILNGAALRGAQKIAKAANGGDLPEVELSGEEWDAASLSAFQK